MAKSKTASFVVELGLVTHQNEQVVLDKRFKIAEKLYNKVLYHAQTQLTELYKNHRYQDVLAERRLSIKANDKNRVTACNKELQTIQKTFGMTEYALHAYIGRMREAYKKHIDSFTAQKIASTVWTSVSSLLYGKGKKVRFKKFGQLESLEGKSNATGMRFKGTWGDLPHYACQRFIRSGIPFLATGEILPLGVHATMNIPACFGRHSTSETQQ